MTQIGKGFSFNAARNVSGAPQVARGNAGGDVAQNDSTATGASFPGASGFSRTGSAGRVANISTAMNDANSSSLNRLAAAGVFATQYAAG